MGDVSLPFIPARVLAPDDIGLPYLTGVDNAGLSLVAYRYMGIHSHIIMQNWSIVLPGLYIHPSVLPSVPVCSSSQAQRQHIQLRTDLDRSIPVQG
jgi:hypothetical protein